MRGPVAVTVEPFCGGQEVSEQIHRVSAFLVSGR